MRPEPSAPYHPANTADAARIARLRSMSLGLETQDKPLSSMAIVAFLVVASISGTVGAMLAWWFLA